MSFSITENMVRQFYDNVLMLSQQRDSRLQKTCQIKTGVKGDSFTAERIGSGEMYERTTRHQDVQFVHTPHSRRIGFIHDMEYPDLLDKHDEPKVLTDIRSPYVQAAVAAANRAKDRWIINALGGVANAGKNGTDLVNCYDVGECRIINGDGTLHTAGSDGTDTTETTLTAAKVLLAKYLLDSAEVDPSRKRYFVTNAYNLQALLSSTEYGSEEFKAARDIVQGKIGMLHGFEFIQVEYRSTGTGLQMHSVDTTCVESFAFAEGSVTFGIGGDIDTMIERNVTKNATQITTTLNVGAVRNEGPAAVKVLLKAAP